jgi:predicted ribosomally synthesized peptide with SipW-like signal peptide
MRSAGQEPLPVGFLLIAGFYALGVAAVTLALFTDRTEVGAKLASVHGLTALAGLPIMLLTIAAGIVVLIAFCEPRPWAFWTVVGYMAYLLVVPPLVVGPGRISVFANIVWPLCMLAYLLWRHRLFGVGDTRGRPTRACFRDEPESS